jgi:hypothetical protein
MQRNIGNFTTLLKPHNIINIGTHLKGIETSFHLKGTEISFQIVPLLLKSFHLWANYTTFKGLRKGTRSSSLVDLKPNKKSQLSLSLASARNHCSIPDAKVKKRAGQKHAKMNQMNFSRPYLIAQSTVMINQSHWWLDGGEATPVILWIFGYKHV